MSVDLKSCESNVTSQTGEDGVISRIFDLVGDGGKVAAEFGAADGKWLSNTWNLEHARGWRRWLFDGCARAPEVVETLLTAENINEVFDAAGVPQTVDCLSIDVDGNDFWLWKALNRRARLVIVEYNPAIRPGWALVMPYNPKHVWDHTTYYGASLKALDVLGHAKGYRLIHKTLLNGFFLLEEEAELAGLSEIPATWECYVEHVAHGVNKTWVNIV